MNKVSCSPNEDFLFRSFKKVLFKISKIVVQVFIPEYIDTSKKVLD